MFTIVLEDDVIDEIELCACVHASSMPVDHKYHLISLRAIL
jgi:hypothetical protein